MLKLVYITYFIIDYEKPVHRSFPHSPQFFPQANLKKTVENQGVKREQRKNLHRYIHICGDFLGLQNNMSELESGRKNTLILAIGIPVCLHL